VPDALAPPPAAVQLDAEDEADDEPPTEEAVRASARSINQVVAALPAAPLTPNDLMLVNARNQRTRPPKQDTGGGVTVLKQLLVLCAKSGASDIHVEPKRDDVQVRIRVDGMMVEAVQLHTGVANRLIGVVRILCDLDITQKNAVQDGHFSAEAPAPGMPGGRRRIDYRVSFTPSMHGQKLVIRVLDQAVGPQRIDDLQLPGWMGDQIRNLVKQDSGMLIVCGPTGSGKTTSLYAAIRGIDAGSRNIITIEDPPEYQIDGVTQIPINEQQGNTFSTLLRSVLRQDPDVILLGEIRDPETARIALQAAMTGHLVLSTVHARDTMGTIFRLLDLGVEPYLIASALNLVLSQRLVRKLCDHCKQGVAPKPQQVMKMGRFGSGLRKIYFPAGCPKCLNTGYHGRIGIYELLTTNSELRDVILKQPTMQELRKAINMELFNSLRESGHRLVVEGVTSLDEIDRVLGVE
jgi:general secretion pathway protein E